MHRPAASLHKNIEFFLLEQDLKPVIRHGYYDEELDAVEQYCRDKNLYLVHSSFRVAPTEQGFSNKGRVAEKGMVFVYVSKDEILAHKAALAEVKKEHVKLGLLLGYPECCCNFFAKHAARKEKRDYDFEDLVVQHSKEEAYPFFMNIFQRHQDACVLSHFPCSLDCAESHERGAVYFQTMLQHVPKTAQHVEKLLSGKKRLFGRTLHFGGGPEGPNVE